VEWVKTLPTSYLLGRDGTNKILVRQHIEQHVGTLPYVNQKGSFRFDLVTLAQRRFDQVLSIAEMTAQLVPGAPTWLKTNRARFKNKYFASKFYLLAVMLPWLAGRIHAHETTNDAASPGST